MHFMQRGGQPFFQIAAQGVAFCDALDRREAYPALPGYESVESVQACLNSVWGEVHTSLLTLLKGVAPKSGNPGAGRPTSGNSAGTAADGSSTAPPGSAGGAAGSLGGGAGGDVGGAGSGGEESPLMLRLCASAEGLELVRATDPVFTQTLGQVLSLLRVFSFS